MERTPDLEWNEDAEFDLVEGINKTHGIVFEIAGPTSYGYKQIGDMSRITKPIVVSNITNGITKYDMLTGELRGFDGKVDMLTDAKNISLKDGSVGTLMVSCLPKDLASHAIEEMERVVEPGGFVVWQYGDVTIGKALIDKGFILKSFQQFGQNEQAALHFVFQKNPEAHVENNTQITSLTL